jgi:drug/metabolite transporter (DMT)-like permease
MGYGAALAGALAIGASGVVNKMALTGGAAPLRYVATVSLLAALLLSPWLFRPLKLRGSKARLGFAVLVGNIAAPLFLVTGLSRTTAATASLLVNVEMVATAILAYVFLRERTPWKRALALGTIGAGSLVASLGAPMTAPEGWALGSFAGVALIAGGTLCFAIDNVLSQPLVEGTPIKPMMARRFLAGAAATTTVAWVVTRGVLAWGFLPHAAFFSVVGVSLNTLLFLFALRMVGATRSAVLTATAAFWGALAAVLFLHERLVWPHYVGGAMMAIGIAWLAWSSREEGPSAGRSATHHTETFSVGKTRRPRSG